MDGTEMTAEGRDALQAEINRLETEERSRMAEQIKVARSWGDLSENAEYHAAKEAQAHLETRIAVLRERLVNAVVVERATGEEVGFGSTVDVRDEETGTERAYTLVAALESAPAEGRISVESPIAGALRGRRAGDIAEVKTPRGVRRLRIVAVR
jgi:transcription elongation factor GreA